MEREDLKNVAIHCATEEEAKQVCNLTHQLGWKWCGALSYYAKKYWNIYKENTCYNFYEGYYANKQFYLDKGYRIESTQWFLDNFTSKEEKPNVFVYIRGNEERGTEVIELLEKLGGKNLNSHKGNSDDTYIYFINDEGCIDISHEEKCKWIIDHYTEVFLPEQKADPKYTFKPFDKVLVRDEDDDGNFWKIELFSHYDASSEYPYYCLSSNYSKCIPYEGNEHLLGTTDNV